MQNIIQELTNSNYPFDPIKNLNLNKYLSQPRGLNVMYGMECYSGKIDDNYKNILIDFEEPNFITSRFKGMKDDYSSTIRKLNKKLTLCPYTAKYFNSLLNKTNSEQCFFPVDVEYIISRIGYPTFDKKRNVLYIGNNVSRLTDAFINISEKVSMPSYMDKIQALYNTKIAICHNVLFYENLLSDYNELINIIPELKDDNFEVPQLKSRIFEAGFSKCIPLVYFHKSKIVETYFVPDVDFIYFRTFNELILLINKIVNDYDSYKYIAENIYKKCVENYKVSDFIEKYITV